MIKKIFVMIVLFLNVSMPLNAMAMKKDGVLSAMERGEKERGRRRVVQHEHNQETSYCEIALMAASSLSCTALGMYIVCAVDDHDQNTYNTASETFEPILGISTGCGLVGFFLGKQLYDCCKEKND